MSKNSVLKVFLNDKPEPSGSLKDLNLFKEGNLIIYHSEKFVFEDSNVHCFHFLGCDVSIRFFACTGKEWLTLYSIPEVPVVTLHIQMYYRHYAQFEDGRDGSLWTEHQFRFCVQKDEIITYQSPDGFLSHFDLFIRPSLILAWAEKHPVLRELAIQLESGQPSSLNFLVGIVDDDDLEELKESILDELQDMKVSNERFLHLCECLLLCAMGESIPVEPIPRKDVKSQYPPVVQLDKLFTEEQIQYIANLWNFSREDLLKMFYESKAEYFEKEVYGKDYYLDLARMEKLYFDIVGDAAYELADKFLQFAAFLDKQSEKFQLDKGELEIIGIAIMNVCERSFELREPDSSQVDLYSKWSENAFSRDMEIDSDMDFSNLWNQKELESFFSANNVDNEINKPKEIVELYHMLLKKMSNIIQVKGQEVDKNDNLLFVLEHAYGANNFKHLLLLEILYCSSDEQYVEYQSFERIGWWVMALKQGSKEIDEINADIRDEQPLHRLMEIYESSPGKEKDVMRYAYEKKEIYEDLVSMCMKIESGLERQLNKSLLMTIAEALTEIV